MKTAVANKLKISETICCDYLVAGSGLAGIRAAFDCAKTGKKVLWLTDGNLCSGSSFYPLTAGLGSQLPDDEEDIPVFLEEVLETGCTMADPVLTEIVIREITEQIRKLPEIGMQPERCINNRPACFAKKDRLLYAWRGWDTIRENVRKIFAAKPNVTVREHCDLARLDVRDNAVKGALFTNENGQLCYAHCGALILATGGYCGLYKHSLNTNETTGVGHSVAMDAGADLINLEFLQFIPGFTKPVYKLLFSETTLRRAVAVKNADGEDALEDYLKELPEEDRVSMKDCLEDRAMHGPFTTEDRSRYFEQAMMKDAQEYHRECGFEITFDPGIAEDDNGFIRKAREMYAKFNIDLSKDRIWLGSFAHCCNGGIRIGAYGETCVDGLFAAGETAGGVHGADRHGGMATAAALVFGSRAAQGAEKYLKEREGAGPTSDSGIGRDAEQAAEELIAWITPEKDGGLSAESILKELEEKLWYECNCCREGNRLKELLGWIRDTRRAYDARKAAETECLKKALRTFHGLRTAEALVLAMLERDESRGPHYRSDCPEKKKELDGRRVLVAENGGKIEAQTERSRQCQ